MAKSKVSLITTVFNEESSIEHLLSTIAAQSYKPDEVIIVDAGSKDKTVKIAQSFKPIIKNLKILVKKGANRSVGRNTAIKTAKNDVIAMTDAGCTLDKDWLLEIVRPFSDKRVEVVAGYYQAKPTSIFQKCVVPYALVMPDKIDPRKFLPSSRSMAIRKSVWKETGGFPVEYSDNEDFVFAHTLKKSRKKIVFSQNALVYWKPRKNLKEFWIMIYRFARGDAKAGLRRTKIAFIFLRYVFLIFFVLSCLIFRPLIVYLLASIFLYLVWSIYKNYHYVKDVRAICILPLLQITADLAIIFGSVEGGLKSG